MKMEKILGKVKKELKNEKEKEALNVLKQSLKDVSSAKKTLKKLEKAHQNLLKTDIDDLELEGFEY